ncbi:activating transcription factor 4b [Xenentodon cancila]
MTMMTTSSQFGLEDMEALLWEPSSPMADVMDSMFTHPDKDGQQEGGGTSPAGEASPSSPFISSSLSSSSSPPPFYSPPSSPPAVLLHGDKAESDLLPLPWLDLPGQLRCSQTLSDESRENALSDLDWMAERVDLDDLDLDCLIGPCRPDDEPPSSPEELLVSLDCSMELDSFHLPTLSTPDLSTLAPASFPDVPCPTHPTVCSDQSVIVEDESEPHIDGQEVPSSPICVPEPQEELEIKSEPASPEPSSPVADSPSSPDFTLDLGSEVDVSEIEVKPVVPQVPKIVLSLSPNSIVLLLAPKNGATATSEVIQCSPPASPLQRSPRSRMYPEPTHKASPPSTSTIVGEVKLSRTAGRAERMTLKAPKDKKWKKMEQNKTAATRYRQKKKAEQDSLLAEHVLLERKNMELTEKAESMAREIEYLKELMAEVHQARRKRGLGKDP